MDGSWHVLVEEDYLNAEYVESLRSEVFHRWRLAVRKPVPGGRERALILAEEVARTYLPGGHGRVRSSEAPERLVFKLADGTWLTELRLAGRVRHFRVSVAELVYSEEQEVASEPADSHPDRSGSRGRFFRRN